jgi:lipooligosaccharide transport system ATP-binding protein
VGTDVVEAWGEPAALPAVAEGFDGPWEVAGRRLYLFCDRRQGVAELMDRAASTGGIERVLHRPANLEDVFLRLTGRGLRE